MKSFAPLLLSLVALIAAGPVIGQGFFLEGTGEIPVSHVLLVKSHRFDIDSYRLERRRSTCLRPRIRQPSPLWYLCRSLDELLRAIPVSSKSEIAMACK
jgi:hypothetical protein